MFFPLTQFLPTLPTALTQGQNPRKEPFLAPSARADSSVPVSVALRSELLQEHSGITEGVYGFPVAAEMRLHKQHGLRPDTSVGWGGVGPGSLQGLGVEVPSLLLPASLAHGTHHSSLLSSP